MPAQDRASRYPLLIILGVFGVLFLIGFCSPMGPTKSEVSPMNRTMVNAVGLAKVCRFYASDHGGKPAAHLRDPEFLEEFGIERFEECLYRDPKSGKKMEWLYFPPASLSNPKPGEIMIASPIPYKGRRIVAYSDATARIIKNEDFEAQYPVAKPLGSSSGP